MLKKLLLISFISITAICSPAQRRVEGSDFHDDKFLISARILSGLNTTDNSSMSDPLTWQTLKADAVSLAKDQGKKILLVAGWDKWHEDTEYMRYTVFESMDPPVKTLIEEYFILWFCDVSSSVEWGPYASGLEWNLPLICFIDPDNSEGYVYRKMGTQTPEEFYPKLKEILNIPPYAPLVWQTSKADAVSLANDQGKKILLLAGREACGNTRYMRYKVSESMFPPIKTLIKEHFILWYCDVDSSTEWYPYASGIEQNWFLPLICCIDLKNIDGYIDRTTGTQAPEEFYSRLQDITNFIDCDINYSGKIDLRDAILVLQGLASINVGYLNTEVDLNGDGKIGIEEAIYIFQKISKLR